MHPLPPRLARVHRNSVRPVTERDDVPPPRRAVPAGIGYLHARLAADMQARIEAGEWTYGAKLPGREELAEEYGVADRTVRPAMRTLQARGYVTILPSKGVYVTWRVHG